MSAAISRAERNAVSPEVMAHATTPIITKDATNSPRVATEMTFTILAALPPYWAMALFNPSVPPQNAMAMAAQIRAMILSVIMAP